MSISFFYYSIKFGSYTFLQAQKYKNFRQCADEKMRLLFQNMRERQKNVPLQLRKA